MAVQEVKPQISCLHGLTTQLRSFLLQKRLCCLACNLHIQALQFVYKIVLHKPLLAVQASELKIIQACFVEGTWFPWQFIKDGGLVSSLEQMTVWVFKWPRANSDKPVCYVSPGFPSWIAVHAKRDSIRLSSLAMGGKQIKIREVG